MNTIKSRTEDHLHFIASHRSDLREIDPTHAADDVELLAQIGYKQELRRHYSTLQVFGIAYSIMGLLPSICSTIASGLECGAGGFVWAWLIGGVFILSIGFSMTMLGSAIPTSGGLYYYTNYYAPDGLRVPLSFLVGCANSLGLIGGMCSICYGFAVEILSAVYINLDGAFEITNGKCYGIFAACIISNVILCCLTTKHQASLFSDHFHCMEQFHHCFVLHRCANRSQNSWVQRRFVHFWRLHQHQRLDHRLVIHALNDACYLDHWCF